jgi:hypothetical protein
MVKQASVTLTGVSGRSYNFEVFPWGTQFNRVGAVYTVLRRRPEGNYDILYIGETGDLSERFDDHHKQACFNRNGKTHLGVRPEPSESGRLAIETDLVRNYKTPCND